MTCELRLALFIGSCGKAIRIMFNLPYNLIYDLLTKYFLRNDIWTMAVTQTIFEHRFVLFYLYLFIEVNILFWFFFFIISDSWISIDVYI